MRPTRRLAQTLADAGGLALQEIHLARRAPRLLLGDTSRMQSGVADTPVRHPLLTGLREVMGEEDADVDAYPARADHGDPLAHLHRTVQHVGVGDDLRVGYPFQGWDPGHDTGGDNDIVESFEVGRCRPCRQSEVDTEHLQPPAVVAQSLCELLLAGDLHGEPELATDRGGG